VSLLCTCYTVRNVSHSLYSLSDFSCWNYKVVRHTVSWESESLVPTQSLDGLKSVDVIYRATSHFYLTDYYPTSQLYITICTKRTRTSAKVCLGLRSSIRESIRLLCFSQGSEGCKSDPRGGLLCRVFFPLRNLDTSLSQNQCLQAFRHISFFIRNLALQYDTPHEEAFPVPFQISNTSFKGEELELGECKLPCLRKLTTYRSWSIIARRRCYNGSIFWHM